MDILKSPTENEYSLCLFFFTFCRSVGLFLFRNRTVGEYSFLPRCRYSEIEERSYWSVWSKWRSRWSRVEVGGGALLFSQRIPGTFRHILLVTFEGTVSESFFLSSSMSILWQLTVIPPPVFCGVSPTSIDPNWELGQFNQGGGRKECLHCNFLNSLSIVWYRRDSCMVLCRWRSFYPSSSHLFSLREVLDGRQSVGSVKVSDLVHSQESLGSHFVLEQGTSHTLLCPPTPLGFIVRY